MGGAMTSGGTLMIGIDGDVPDPPRFISPPVPLELPEPPEPPDSPLGKFKGLLDVEATSAVGACEPFGPLMPPVGLPVVGSSLATNACTWGWAFGASASATWTIKRICSGAAVIAASTMAATVSGLASELSMAALTISAANSGLSDTSWATIVAAFDGSAATAFFTDSTCEMASTAADAEINVIAVQKTPTRRVCFMV